MDLYEKDKDSIYVYKLKERQDKLFEFKRKEMEKNGKNGLVYSIFSNNSKDMDKFELSKEYNMDDFIKKYNNFFKHRKGLKLCKNQYSISNRNNIDGLLYQLYCGKYDLYDYRVKKMYDKDINDVKKYFLQTTMDRKFHKLERFNGESYEYELPNILSIPESIYLLMLLRYKKIEKIGDKNIDEQLALFDFEDIPTNKLDLNTIKFINKNFITDESLEVDQNILKKVRQLNK